MDTIVKLMTAISSLCSATVCVSMTNLHPLREQLQRAGLYSVSGMVLFSAFPIYSLASQIVKNQDLSQAFTFLGLIGIILGCATLCGTYFRFRSVYLTMLFATSLVLLFTGVSSVILFAEIKRGHIEKASGQESVYKINLRISNNSVLMDCIADLKERSQVSKDCREVLKNATLSPSKLMLVWTLLFMSIAIFSTALWNKRLGLLCSEVESRKSIDLLDIGFTALFVIVFISGYGYMKALDEGNYKVITLTSPRLLAAVSPLTSHSQFLVLSQSTVSQQVYSSKEPCSPLGTNFVSIIKKFDNGTLLLEKNETVRSTLNNLSCNATETMNGTYTYLNQTKVSYITIKTTVTDRDGRVSTTQSSREEVSEPTPAAPKANPSTASRRRRLLSEVPLSTPKKQVSSHFQGPPGSGGGKDGGDFIWISCFTGFGESSLIHINTITGDQPTMEDCRRRLGLERPDFTLDKLRLKYNDFVKNNPSAV